jgi:hypothetical protein
MTIIDLIINLRTIINSSDDVELRKKMNQVINDFMNSNSYK